MAYNGYLIRVGDYTIPMDYIKYDTYSVTNHGQDLEAYNDANGDLHREALDNFIPKVEFNTIMLTNKKMNDLLSNIRRNYTNTVEKKLSASIYIPEYDAYVSQSVYMPDITFQIYKIDGNEILYNTTRLAFIGYGANG